MDQRTKYKLKSKTLKITYRKIQMTLSMVMTFESYGDDFLDKTPKARTMREKWLLNWTY